VEIVNGAANSKKPVYDAEAGFPACVWNGFHIKN